MRKITFALLVILLAAATGTASGSGIDTELRMKASKAFLNGNYQDALTLYEHCLDSKTDPGQVGDDLKSAVSCLGSLNRFNEIDAFREKVVNTHDRNWRLLWSAAKTFMEGPHYGYIIAGEFSRGHHRGGGKYVNSFERDRVNAIRLMETAETLFKAERDGRESGRFYLEFSDMLIQERGESGSWRLQYLTDLKNLPDYEEGGYFGFRGRGRAMGAPVDADGNPVLYRMPESWDTAASDGERWRWLLKRTAETDPLRKIETMRRFANFLYKWFGVQTMAEYSGLYDRFGSDDDSGDESGTYALHTLAEDETIARLATGIKRFHLPDEFNFIRLFKETGDNAVLARIFENRRQYVKAARYWNKSRSPDRVKQIIGNWGVFEPLRAQPAGRGGTVDYRFRNGSRVSFTAWRIKTKQLLNDVKEYIKSNPRRVEWTRENLGNIGYRIVHENEKRYVGKKIARWSLDLVPRPNHFDRRITVTTPLQEAGAYLVEAKMDHGNTSRIIIWINDTVIVKKPLSNRALFYVADAVTGRPVTDANVEFFGFRRDRRDKKSGHDTTISNFAEYTDSGGQVILSDNFRSAARLSLKEKKSLTSHQGLSSNMRWLITATTPEGRLAYLGFSGIWYQGCRDQRYDNIKAFTITDRPVYRPGQTVKFKFWMRYARYDLKDTSGFAGDSFTVRIENPKGEKVFEKDLVADKWGGFDHEFKLEDEAALGNYRLYVPGRGGGRFRVEEYKKPEFEVKVEAPSRPVAPGETITAKINAKYYFGAPVINATVRYKVIRHSHTAGWYPPGPWDWFYGPGYWWYAYDYSWYPGWRKWGLRRPVPWWWDVRTTPPEVVMENEVEIDENGIVEVKIDTSVAKEFHPDQDHRYEIIAEVTDLSRRTIVGKGSVLAARRPFSVHAWVDRGYYRTGDTISANFKAQTLDNKPVQGRGELKLLKISYDKENRPVESVVQTWGLDTDLKGSSHVRIKAALPGQYRLSYTVTDAKEHSIEGGYLFVVRGHGFDGTGFCFNDIELIPNKAEYAPGEKVRLMINTNRPGSFVMLFVRPVDGVYSVPEIIRMRGKSVEYEIDVVKKDMPNFFIEAITISDGRLFTGMREIIVPPEKRVLNVEVKPSSERFKPGEKAELTVKLTDFQGQPFVGSTVLAVYDKSVEYISNGSNVQDIRAFFWKWRRRHNSRTESNLDRIFQNLLKKNETPMRHLGVFGHLVADEMDDMEEGESTSRMGRAGGIHGAVAPMMAMQKSRGRNFKEMKTDIAAEEQEMSGPASDESGSELVQPDVRTEFVDTAFWAAGVTTDKKGLARVDFKMPENLTAWQIKVWAMGHGTRVGEAASEVVTAKDLMVRLQAPRFFVQKDEVVLSANVHNYLNDTKSAKMILELDGPCLELLAGAAQTVQINPDNETRVDWRVAVVRQGEAVVRIKALTDEESDAMEMRFPVYVHGMDKMVPFCGVIRPEDDHLSFTITVPAERRPDASRLEIRYSPTLAGAMVDALPYLADYPYGCTEQTLNRFVPTVITQNVLKRLGLDLTEIKVKQTNLNAQELGSHAERAAQWKHWEQSPVFDEDEVVRMVKKGVMRLTSMQLSDGGWGWFSGWGEHSSPHTTATVVHGLQIAMENRVAIVPSVMGRGIDWLARYQDKEVQKIKNHRKDPKVRPWKEHADNIDAFVYRVLADADILSPDMREFLYEDRNRLSVYGKALYGLGLERQGHLEKLKMIMKNIDQYLVLDDENQTAYLNLGNGGYWWHWYGSEIEAHACYLKLLCRTNPQGDKAPRLVKYLLNNRKHATYWNSTRDTAYCIEAFAEYLKASGEETPDMTVFIMIDNKKMKQVRITPENLFTFENSLVLKGESVTTGAHTIELQRKGRGPLYFNAYLSYFTLEDYITKAGLEIKVNRRFYKLNRIEKSIKTPGSRGRALDQRVEKYERVPLKNLAMVKSGDLVEVEMEILSKNDYEYIVIEDMKAAGFEPVEVRSGYTANGLNAYMELRDERTAFFLRTLARGRHSISYRLRAEIPGRFSALPARALGMYAPELRANSDEIKLMIQD